MIKNQKQGIYRIHFGLGGKVVIYQTHWRPYMHKADSNEDTGAFMLAEQHSAAAEVQKEIARQAAVPGRDRHPTEPTQNTL